MILSPSQVAKRLGVGLPYIYTLLAAGKLPGERVDGRWQITESAVLDWKTRTEKRKHRNPQAEAEKEFDAGAQERPLPCG